MTIKDKRLDKIAFNRQYIIKKLDRKEMSQEEYDKEMRNYDDELKALQTELIHAEKKDQIKTNEDLKMEKEEEVKEKKTGGRTPNPNSYTMTIIKVLEMKSIKTIEDSIIKVDEMKPGRDSNKIKTQVKSIINLVKKGEGRWANYEWNQEEFSLTEKTQ